MRQTRVNTCLPRVPTSHSGLCSQCSPLEQLRTEPPIWSVPPQLTAWAVVFQVLVSECSNKATWLTAFLASKWKFVNIISNLFWSSLNAHGSLKMWLGIFQALELSVMLHWNCVSSSTTWFWNNIPWTPQSLWCMPQYWDPVTWPWLLGWCHAVVCMILAHVIGVWQWYAPWMSNPLWNPWLVMKWVVMCWSGTWIGDWEIWLQLFALCKAHDIWFQNKIPASWMWYLHQFCTE